MDGDGIVRLRKARSGGSTSEILPSAGVTPVRTLSAYTGVSDLFILAPFSPNELGKRKLS